MKYLLILTIVPLLFTSCNSEIENKTITDSGTFKKGEILDTCLCNDLDIDSTGNHLMKEIPYTGICVEYYPETEYKYLEKSLLDGKMHGKIIVYNRAGEILVEEMYESGVKKRDGEVEDLICNCTELEQKASSVPEVPILFILDEIPYTGICHSFYRDSEQKYMEITYKKGIPHGRTYYYDREGETMYIEKYEMGELIGTVY